MILDGIILMLAGMGTVFVFLCIMVGVTKLMSKVVTTFEKPVKPVESKQEDVQQNLTQIAAVIAIARKHYRLT